MQEDSSLDSQTIQKLICFRREIHQNPQTCFNEYQTRKRIIGILKSFGIEDGQITLMQPTALIVNISGGAPATGVNRCIAFRADMDALSMQQANKDLPYKSQNKGAAHMCGHDGHITCLVAFVPLFLQAVPKIPKNKTIRLLFQPSEEGPESGAKLMIEKGCLENVDEVYGFHNWPTAPLGELWCQEGPVMSQCTQLHLVIKGVGGHGSEPQKCKECIRAGVKFYHEALQYLDCLKKEKQGKFVCTLPVFQAGERNNVITQTLVIEGTIRSFEEGLSEIVVAKFKQILQKIEKEGFKVDFKAWKFAPAVVNTKEQAEHVLRVGRQVFGVDKVGKGELPFRASEDFSYFTKSKPGAFFFLSTGQGQKSPMLHNASFDFNDLLIKKAATFWYRFALDRLQI